LLEALPAPSRPAHRRSAAGPATAPRARWYATPAQAARQPGEQWVRAPPVSVQRAPSCCAGPHHAKRVPRQLVQRPRCRVRRIVARGLRRQSRGGVHAQACRCSDGLAKRLQAAQSTPLALKAEARQRQMTRCPAAASGAAGRPVAGCRSTAACLCSQHRERRRSGHGPHEQRRRGEARASASGGPRLMVVHGPTRALVIVGHACFGGYDGRGARAGRAALRSRAAAGRCT